MKINRKFISTFYIPAILLWVFSLWEPHVYHLAVHKWFPSQFAFMQHLIGLAILLSFLYLIILIITIRKKFILKRSLIGIARAVREIIIFYAALLLIFFCAISISLYRNPVWRNEFF